MKTFHMKDDPVRLYFTNSECRPDDEEFEEVVAILKKNHCEFADTIMGPDCDLIKCQVDDVEFNIIRTIDGNGTFIYCDDSKGMRTLEMIFER